MSRRFIGSILGAIVICALGIDARAQDHNRRRRAPPTADTPQHGRDEAGDGKPREHEGRRRRPPGDPGRSWRVRKRPTIARFSPTSGPPRSVVTVFGDHFDDSTTVRFNGRTLRVVQRGAGWIKVRLPRRSVSDRFVVAKPGFRDVTSDGQFFVARRPKILRVDPLRGTPGVVLKVYGEHFLPSDQLLLNNVPLQILKARPRRIKARLPQNVASGRLQIRRGARIVAASRQLFQVALPPPSVARFSPKAGSPGTVVRIYGSNFDTRDQVRLAGRLVTVRRRSTTMLEVVIGRHNTGRFAVTGIGGRLAESRRQFIIIRPPRLARFAPRYGAPGTRIRIFGNHFLQTDQPYLSGRALTVRTISATQIVAEIPAGVASGPITLKRGTREFRARGIFRVHLPPAIADVKPTAAPPGSVVLVEGQNFTRDVSVMLTGQRLRIVKRRLPGQLWVQIPANGRTGRLVVLTAAGSTAWRRNFLITQYASIRAFYPLVGVAGSKIRIQGRNFGPGVRVYLGRYPLIVRRVRGHKLVAEVPANIPPTSARIVVESFGRKVASSLKFRLTVPPPEVAFRFGPHAGRRGSEVTLFLSPPRRYVSVYYDGRLLPKRVLRNGAQVIVTIPGDARSGYFEVEYRGRRYRARRRFRVLR